MHGMLVHGQQAELDIVSLCNRASGPMFKHLARREILQKIAAFPARYNRHVLCPPSNNRGLAPCTSTRQRRHALSIDE
jgi:hypothetical protein